MTTSPSATMLQQQAQRAFEDSDRLLSQAARDTVADQRFRQAATRYAATLRTYGAIPAGPIGTAAVGVGNGTGGSGTFPSATSATGLGGTGNPLTGPGGVAVATGSAAPGPAAVAGGIPAATGGLTNADLASVAAINHEVKEALGALRIRQMFRTPTSTDSPTGQFLMTHALQMDTQSRTAIQAILNGGGGTPTTGPVQALAQQANDVIQALQGIGR